MRTTARQGDLRDRSRPAYRALMSLVWVSNLVQKAGDRFFQQYGLTQSQFNVLMVVRDAGSEGLTQVQLSERLLVNAADVAGLARRMLGKKWLARRDHPTDRRAWLLRLSPAGRKILSRVEPSYYRKVGHVMGGVSAAESWRLLDCLQCIREGAEKEV